MFFLIKCRKDFIVRKKLGRALYLQNHKAPSAVCGHPLITGIALLDNERCFPSGSNYYHYTMFPSKTKSSAYLWPEGSHSNFQMNRNMILPTIQISTSSSAIFAIAKAVQAW